MSLGFIKAGFKLSAGFENWDCALECYNENLNDLGHKLDLSDIELASNEIAKYSPQIIIGGPPCQDFSLAGKQIEGERANLTYSFAKIISVILPDFFVMENVQQVIGSDAYLKSKRIFKEKGYGLTEKVLDASYCNVPQKRKRFFCIGALNQKDDFLEIPLSGNHSVFPMTVREYIDFHNINLGIEYYYRHPRTYGRRAVFSIDEPSPTVRGVNRPKPENYKKHNNDPVNPQSVRALSIIERSYIQTFPVDYIWKGSDSVINQMIGNAVPVNLAFYVARALNDYIKGKIDPTNISFVDWLQSEKKMKKRAAGDVLSRASRARKILAFSNYKKDNYIKNLLKTKEFSRLNKTVQTQVKRAATLYFEYKKKG